MPYILLMITNKSIGIIKSVHQFCDVIVIAPNNGILFEAQKHKENRDEERKQNIFSACLNFFV